MKNGGLNIMLVDDQNLFIESLKRVLESEAELVNQVYVAHDGEEAIKMVDSFVPDVILMDVHMPNMNGIEATGFIHRKRAEIKIIILSAFGYDDYVAHAMQQGASGYILKDISPEELIVAIRKAYNGEVIPVAKSSGLSLQTRQMREDRKQLPEWYKTLSMTERSIVLLIAKGYSNKEIVEHANLGEQTVRNYVSAIYDKLGVSNRFEAMRAAIEGHIEDWVSE